jgi:uncharacterized delta-60 repeat protein
MNASKRCIAVVVMTAAGTILPIASPVSVAAPNRAGDLDPTFGGDGKVTTNFRSGEELRNVAIDADGKIVVAGCTGGHGSPIALARYNPNGTLDTSFGGGGKVTTDLAHKGGDCALDVAIQDDGKIVAAGHSGFGGPHAKFAVVRYRPDGTLDKTFGGDGWVSTDFTPDSDFAAAVAIQADGKIIAAGQSGVFGANTMFALARYNPDGTRDTTFGEHGQVTTDFTGGDDGANAVGLQSDGKIVVAGGAGTDSDFGGTGFALARYEADGTLDTSFGEDGLVTTAITVGKGDAAADVEILSNGKILAAGVDGRGGCGPCGSDLSTSFALVRYNADGTIDTGFGGSGEGLVITPLSPKDDAASDLAVQADGRIVVAGVAGRGRRGGGDTWFALVRYDADGMLDPTLGGDGTMKTNFTPNTDFASGMALQADGKFVAAGIADYLGTHDRFALARYFSDAASQPGSDLTQLRFPPQTTTKRLEGAIAGTGREGFSGDGGPATEVRISLYNSACYLGMAIDAEGNLYITQAKYNRVRMIDTNGIITTIAGTGKPGFSGDGGPARKARLLCPESVSADAEGNIYVAEPGLDPGGNHRIRRIDTRGIITTVAGNGEEGFPQDGALATEVPIGGAEVYADADGTIYITTEGNAQIYKVDTDGILTVLAGTGEDGYSGDGGPATEAQLSEPSTVALGPDGNLYIGDWRNNRVRMVVLGP